MTSPLDSTFVRSFRLFAGAFVLAVAIWGFAMHLRGHPMPSHPWAELTLGLLGATNMVQAKKGSPPTQRVITMIVAGALLSGVSAMMWLASAYLRRG